MKKNLIQKIKCLLCGVLLLVPLFPCNIYADTITSSNIIGINRVNVSSTHIQDTSVNVQGLGQITLSQFEYEYEVTVLLDDYYLGYINGSFSTSLNDVYWGTGEIYNRTATKQNMSYYVNGNSFTTSFTIIANMRNIQGGGNIDPTSSYSTTFSLNTSNVVKYQDISSLDQIISILTDIKNNTDIELDYLNEINKLRQYNFPIESFTFVSALLKHHELDVQDYFEDSYYQYPIFNIQGNTEIFKFWANNNDKKLIIFYIDNNIRPSVISNYIAFNYGTYTSISVYGPIYYKNSVLYCLKLEYTNNSGSAREITMSNISSSSFSFVPIYFDVFNSQSVYPVSTDFALVYRISNNLLYNLGVIANGTSASSSSSNDLEDSADDIVQNSSTMFQFENTQNQNMNNALQNINTSYDIGSFGSSFLSSANWVRTQFDNITSSTPFGSVLSFSLLLGLALLIIGKVYK